MPPPTASLAPSRTAGPAAARADVVPAADAGGTCAALPPAPAAAAADPAHCFHCGEPNPAGTRWTLALDGAERHFCCAGCRGIAETIRGAGLDGFYARRDGAALRAAAGDDDEYAQAAVAAEADGLVVAAADGRREVSLLLEGTHCAACVWLIEAWLSRQPGVTDVAVNFATRRASVRWDPAALGLADILRAVATVGYRAYPYDTQRREALARRESRTLLTRTAVAGLAMMQVMMFSVPAYVSVDGVEPEYQTLLDWASLLLTLPVMLYAAVPFFHGAWRDLRFRRLGMDVPVALGLACAFGASVHATVTGGGAVYYDSVAMFVALLLLARYAELRARQRAGDAIEAVARGLPETAERLAGYPASAAAETVPAARLVPGDLVRVASGARIPADGQVVDGRSSVEEALLTGESWPQAKGPGDAVMAGSVNRETPLVVRVTAAGEATTLSALARLVARAAGARPRLARLADRVAGGFVAVLLAIAASAALVWWQVDPSRALAITVAVLVVSCPCALSLATPAALACAAGALGRRQVLAVRADAIETLSKVTHVVFDKTGTLTTGRVQLMSATALGNESVARCQALAAALEQGSPHPVAVALRARAAPSDVARDVEGVVGCGVEGTIGGRRYRVGRPGWVGALHGAALPAAAATVAADAMPVALADESGWLAWFVFGDAVRPSAAPAVAALREMGVALSLVSGDRPETVAEVARALGIDDFLGGATPEDKRAFIACRQGEGAVVAMVGDGINDAPALAQADVSLSLGSAAALTQWTAAVVVLGDDLARVTGAVGIARRAYRIMRENLAWAFAYNIVAIPLAATGHLTPLAAAIGMSASSLLVVGNAMRLLRAGPGNAPGTAAPSRGAARAAGHPS